MSTATAKRTCGKFLITREDCTRGKSIRVYYRRFFHLFKQIAGSDDVAISERMSDAITGHAQTSIGRSYGPPTLKDLAKAVAKFPRFELKHKSKGIIPRVL